MENEVVRGPRPRDPEAHSCIYLRVVGFSVVRLPKPTCQIRSNKGVAGCQLAAIVETHNWRS